MAFIHGKNGVFQLNAVDLSAFTTNVSISFNADAHDVTTYGNNSHRKFGGLFDGTITVDMIWDNGVAGPFATVEPLIGTVTSFTWQPEGVGTGLPSVTGNVLVQDMSPDQPVADMITKSVALERDGDWVVTDQI